MNERILELFVQALEEFKAENKYATIIVPNPLQEKFAELIVPECADVGSKFSQAHPEDIRYQIKRHFGVEE